MSPGRDGASSLGQCCSSGTQRVYRRYLVCAYSKWEMVCWGSTLFQQAEACGS